MSKDGDVQHVIMQLEHERKKRIPVRVDWLLDHDTILAKLKQKQKHQDAIFFFTTKTHILLRHSACRCTRNNLIHKKPRVTKATFQLQFMVNDYKPKTTLKPIFHSQTLILSQILLLLLKRL